MTQDRQDDRQKDQPAGKKVRRAWTKPSLTAYGPIGKLTQGGTGAKARRKLQPQGRALSLADPFVQ